MPSCIPEVNSFLMLTAPGERAAIRRKRHFVQRATDFAVPALLSRCHVPQAEHAIVVPRGDGTTVRRDRQSGDELPVACQTMKFFPCGHVPQAQDFLVLMEGGKCLAVRSKGCPGWEAHLLTAEIPDLATASEVPEPHTGISAADRKERLAIRGHHDAPNGPGMSLERTPLSPACYIPKVQ